MAISPTVASIMLLNSFFSPPQSERLKIVCHGRVSLHFSFYESVCLFVKFNAIFITFSANILITVFDFLLVGYFLIDWWKLFI